MKEEIERAIYLLRYHNEWRKGNEDEMVDPDELGKAIDIVTKFASESLSKEPEKEEEKERGLTIINNDTSNPETINTECNHQHTGINWAGQIECSDCKKVF